MHVKLRALNIRNNLSLNSPENAFNSHITIHQSMENQTITKISKINKIEENSSTQRNCKKNQRSEELTRERGNINFSALRAHYLTHLLLTSSNMTLPTGSGNLATLLFITLSCYI